MSSRAVRRHHRARRRARVIRILSIWFGPLRDHPAFEENDPWIYRRINGITVCSCILCCNKRRARGFNGPVRTRQERLAEIAQREQLEELEEPR